MLINNLLTNTCNNVTYFPLTVNSKRFRDVNSFSPPCICVLVSNFKLCRRFQVSTVTVDVVRTSAWHVSLMNVLSIVN